MKLKHVYTLGLLGLLIVGLCLAAAALYDPGEVGRSSGDVSADASSAEADSREALTDSAIPRATSPQPSPIAVGETPGGEQDVRTHAGQALAMPSGRILIDLVAKGEALLPHAWEQQGPVGEVCRELRAIVSIDDAEALEAMLLELSPEQLAHLFELLHLNFHPGKEGRGIDWASIEKWPTALEPFVLACVDGIHGPGRQLAALDFVGYCRDCPASVYNFAFRLLQAHLDDPEIVQKAALLINFRRTGIDDAFAEEMAQWVHNPRLSDVARGNLLFALGRTRTRVAQDTLLRMLDSPQDVERLQCIGALRQYMNGRRPPTDEASTRFYSKVVTGVVAAYGSEGMEWRLTSAVVLCHLPDPIAAAAALRLIANAESAEGVREALLHAANQREQGAKSNELDDRIMQSYSK